MYKNRMRLDDLINIFESGGHRIMATKEFTDDRLQRLLRGESFQVDEKSITKPAELL